MKNTYLLFGCFLACQFAALGQQISIIPDTKINTSLNGVSAVAFSNDGNVLVAADENGSVKLWDMDDLQLPKSTTRLKGNVLKLEFIKPKVLLAVLENGQLIYLSTGDLSELKKDDLNDKIELVTTDPDDTYVSYINKDLELKTFSLTANMLQSSIDISSRIKKPLYLGYDRFGQQTIVISQDGTAIICNPLNQEIIKEMKLRSDEFHGSKSVIHSASMSNGGEFLVLGIQEVFVPKGGIQGGQPERRNSLLVFDWDTSQEVKRIRLNNRVDWIANGPANEHITYFTKKRFEVTLVNIEKGMESSQITMASFPETMEISPDDNYLAMSDKDGSIFLYALQRNVAADIKILNPPINRSYGESIINEPNVELKGKLTNTSLLRSVTVNGIPATIDADGKFDSKIPLVPGKNRIRIVAEDRHSNQILKDIYLTRENKVNSTDHEQVPYTKQTRFALVIGNAEYEGTAKLFNTVNDAKSMSEALKKLGFEVKTVINGSYEEIKNAIFKYGHDISDADVSLFYYSGHGVEMDGINYLIPVDAQLNSPLDVRQKSVPLTGVLNTIKYTNDDGLNMIILDACRNNPFPTGRRGGAGLAKSTPPGGTVIAYSTAPGSVASDGTGENGLYTGELVKQLLIPQRIEDVFINTRNNVEQISNGNQQPWEEARLKGIFYLSY